MSKELKIMKLEIRIPLLEARPKENAKIVKKLLRQYKQLTGKEFAAAGSETV
jgi:hypothetical protein